MLGAFWPSISQIAQLVVFTYLFGYVFRARAPVADLPQTPMAFGLWLFAGLVAWNAFVPGVVGGAQSIVSQPSMVKKMLFPLALLPLVPVLCGLIESIPGIVAAAALFAFFGHLSTALFVLPLFMFELAATTAGLSYFVAATTVYFRDIPQTLTPTLLIAFYLTPIVYPITQIPARLQFVEQFNPMAVIASGYRWGLLGAPAPSMLSTSATLFSSIAIFAAGWLVFRKLRVGFADVL